MESLRRLRQSGGARQKAADRVMQIMGGMEGDFDDLCKLTNHGESRIAHCIKYDLPGACRLVTVQHDGVIWLLYVGDHEDADRWLENHRGWTATVNKANLRVGQTRVAIPQTDDSASKIGCEITDENLPFLKRLEFSEFFELVPQAKLRRDLMEIREETDPEIILETVELISDELVRNLIFDLLVAISGGHIDEAISRLELFRGQSVEVGTDSDLIEKALESESNSDTIINFTELPPEELARLLDHDKFENWMLFLHPEQKRVVDEDFDFPAILKGVSGSGKTVVLLHRARRLAQMYPNELIGIVTLNRTLATLLRRLIDRLCLNGEDKRIKVQAYYDYFQEILCFLGSEKYLKQFVESLPKGHPMIATLDVAMTYHKNLANEFAVRSRETLDDTWREYWRDEIDKDIDAARLKKTLIDSIGGGFDQEAYIRDEFTLVRSAFPYSDRSDRTGKGYYSMQRKGRSIDFQEKSRSLVLRLLLRYEEYMFAGAMLDETGLAQALFPSIKEFLTLPPSLARRCLLIDEFQDFSTLELRLLKQIPTKSENGLFLAGDTLQKVFVKDFNLGNALLDRNYVSTRTIKKNYRNSRQILRAADLLITKYSILASKSDDTVERLEPELAVRETAMPIALKSNRMIEAAWETARHWIVDGETPPWSVCLVTANADEISVLDILQRCPEMLKPAVLTGDYLEQREIVSVGTLSDVKGLEFSLIVLVGCSSKVIPSPQLPSEEQWRDALRFYVAMTRGRDQVVMTYEGQPSEFLETMRPELLWKESEHSENVPFDRPASRLDESKLDGVKFPPIVFSAPVRPLGLSAGADLVLRRYYQRYVQPRPKKGRVMNRHFTFERWKTPKNLDGLKVSKLFVDTEIRRDLAIEIDSFLKGFGFRLVWDV